MLLKLFFFKLQMPIYQYNNKIISFVTFQLKSNIRIEILYKNLMSVFFFFQFITDLKLLNVCIEVD